MSIIIDASRKRGGRVFRVQSPFRQGNSSGRSKSSITVRLLSGLFLSGCIGLLAYRRKSLSRSGVVGAVITGTTTFGMGGWRWGATLVFFFVSSSLLSHFRALRKALIAADKFSKGSQRDLGQVAANGGIATLLALCSGLSKAPGLRESLQAGYVGALATATADTWATEVGVLSTETPRLITTGQPAAPGSSGGITLLGSGAAAGGALATGLVFWLLQRARGASRALPLTALIGGLLGSFADSFLGASVQAMYYCPACGKETERRLHSCGAKTLPLRGIAWMNNDAVNFLATACGALAAMGLAATRRLIKGVRIYEEGA